MGTVSKPGYAELGSTQPLETQVYEEYYSSRAQTGHTNATRGTYATGETGHVDLVGLFAADATVGQGTQQSQADNNMDMSEVEGEGSSEDELAIGSQAEAPTPRAFETPRYAGQKRDHDGNLLSSVNRTPAPNYAAMFPGMHSKGVVGLSQLFNDTQADSSPISPNIRSDPIFDRPSPVFDRGNRSTPVPESSPGLARKPNRSLSTTEPRSAYRPVDESQRERERLQRQSEFLSSPNSSLGEHDWDDDSEERKIQARAQRAQRKLDASREFTELRAPSNFEHPRRGRKFTASEIVIGLVSAKRKTPGKSKGNAIEISSDPGGDASDESSDPDSHDEFDELSQAIIPSERNDENESSPKPATLQKPAVKSLFLARPTSSPIRGAGEKNPLRYARPVNQAEPYPTPFLRSSQPALPTLKPNAIVENSQPDESQRSALPPRPVLPSSINTGEFISQSQLASLSSNTRIALAELPADTDVLTSSIRPAPESPCSSPVRVPSSTKVAGRREMDAASAAPTPVPQLLNRVSDPKVMETSPVSASASPVATGSGLLSNFETARTQPSEPLSSSHNKNRTPKPSQTTPKKTSGTSRCEELSENAGERSSADPLQAIDVENVNILDAEDVEFHVAMSTVPHATPPSKRARRRRDNISAVGPVVEPADLPMPASPVSTRTQTREVKTTSPPPTKPVVVGTELQPKRGKLKRLRSATTSRTSIHEDRLEHAPVGADATTDAVVTHTSVEGSANTAAPKLDSVAAEAGPPQPPHQTASSAQRVSAITVDTNIAPRTAENEAIDDVRVPNRVWSWFRGSNTYYPATCHGASSTNPSAFKVEFDDGATDEVEGHLVSSLDLQLGDLLKVDTKGLRKHLYKITGFKDRWDGSGTGTPPLTDIRGHATVVLEPNQRASLPEVQAPQAINVPISSIYITNTQWARYEQRGTGVARPYQETAARVRTPILQISTPSTPSSRSRRQTITSAAQSAISLANLVSDIRCGVFSNMAFAISYSSHKEADRGRITHLIQENGGRILPEGFGQLFDPLSSSAELESQDLTLSTTFKELGFVALIADAYSRRTKYMQALALNIPCLAGRWVSDSITKEKIQPWIPYLLPAGESAYLDGAIRSRVLSGFTGETCPASKTLEHRPRLLEGHAVILLSTTTSKCKQDGRSNAFFFLIHALGAKHVARATDSTQVRTLLHESEGWDLVCVEDTKVEGIKAEVEGAKVVGHTYIVQSLILGTLVDE